MPGAVAFIAEALERFVVAIYSSRSETPAGIRAMRVALQGWARAELGEAEGDALVEAVQWPVVKPPAWLTIDDRAVTFTGRWPELDAIDAFQPWNKRPAPTREDEDREYFRREALAVREEAGPGTILRGVLELDEAAGTFYYLRPPGIDHPRRGDVVRLAPDGAEPRLGRVESAVVSPGGWGVRGRLAGEVKS